VESGTPRRLYTIYDACDSLSISRTELYRLLAAGKIEAVKIGRRRLIPAVALDAYVARLLSGAA
jgi:excisionase family DNA binding protein